MLMTGVIVMCESSNGDYVMLMPGASKRKEKKKKKKMLQLHFPQSTP